MDFEYDTLAQASPQEMRRLSHLYSADWWPGPEDEPTNEEMDDWFSGSSPWEEPDENSPF
jgi:hypothetical protein